MELASEQGHDIAVDSNAKHRARITRFGHLRQQSKDMSDWLYAQHDLVMLWIRPQVISLLIAS